MEDTDVTVKSSVPEVQKKVKDINDSTEKTLSDWKDSADYDGTDVIPYQLTATLGEGLENYKNYYLAFNDTMCEGLTFNPESVKIFVDGEEVEAADLVLDSFGGHDWGEWEIVKEATETEDGLKRRVCKRNEEHFEEEVIPATGKQDESSETSSDESVDSTESTESVDSNDSNTDSSKADSSKADTSKAADTSSKAAAAAGTTNPSTGAAAGTMAAGIAVIAALAIVKKKQK